MESVDDLRQELIAKVQQSGIAADLVRWPEHGQSRLSSNIGSDTHVRTEFLPVGGGQDSLKSLFSIIPDM
jgi:hypothetical protein